MRSLVAFSLVCGCVGIAPPCLAQSSVDGSIGGVVVDAQGARLPGVEVILTGARPPLRLVSTTDAAGEYLFPTLSANELELTATKDGFVVRKVTGVRLPAGVHVRVDLTLSVATVQETVSVTAATPIVENRSGTRGVNVTHDFLERVPLSPNREWSSTLLVAPGIKTQDFAPNVTLFFSRGADKSSNVFQLEGADSSRANTSDQGSLALALDAIEDVQIVTAGYDASSPMGLGATVNVVTRSGTNAPSGQVSVSGQARSWNSRNVPGGTSSQTSLGIVELSGGGPLRKDTAWLFGSYLHNDTSRGIARSAEQLALARALKPDFAPFDATALIHAGTLKADVQATSRHRLSAFYQYDSQREETGAATSLFASRAVSRGSLYSVRADTVWTSRLTSTVQVAGNNKEAPSLEVVEGLPQQNVFRTIRANGARLVGVNGLGRLGATRQFTSETPRHRESARFDLTAALNGWGGSHELKTGLFVQRFADVMDRTYVNGGFVLEDLVLLTPTDPSGGVRPFARRIFTQPSGRFTDQRSTNIAWYAQEFWRPLTNLTLGAGVRVESIRRVDRIFGDRTQESVDVGPRFSANWRLPSSRVQVLRGSFNIIHEIPTQTSATVGTVGLPFRDEYDANGDGLFETVLETPGSSERSRSRLFDLDRRQPYAYDASASHSVGVGTSTTIEAGLTYRSYRKRLTLLEQNARYEGQRFVGFADESQNQIYLVTNNEWNWPSLVELEVSATKHTGRLSLIASYSRQIRWMSGEYQPGDPASFIQPGTFSNNRGIGSTAGSGGGLEEADSLSSGLSGWQGSGYSQWQDHTVRLGIAAVLPANILVGLSHTTQSGAWSGPIYASAPADPAFGPPTVTLGNGRVAANPLATTFRFAGSDRSDGQFTLPTYHALSARISYERGVGKVKVKLFGDVYNALNWDADQSLAGANWDFSPAFRTLTQRQQPRGFQLGVSCRY